MASINRVCSTQPKKFSGGIFICIIPTDKCVAHARTHSQNIRIIFASDENRLSSKKKTYLLGKYNKSIGSHTITPTAQHLRE